MGQTREQVLHFVWHASLTCMDSYPFGRGALRGATQLERVPMGQNEHQVRGAKMKERTTPTMVVTIMMFQNTRPMAPQSPQAKYICTPNMVKMKSTMKRRNPVGRTKRGMGLWGEYFDSTLSYRLPRGQALPHHHLPLFRENATGAIMHIRARKPITGQKYPTTIYISSIQ